MSSGISIAKHSSAWSEPKFRKRIRPRRTREKRQTRRISNWLQRIWTKLRPRIRKVALNYWNISWKTICQRAKRRLCLLKISKKVIWGGLCRISEPLCIPTRLSTKRGRSNFCESESRAISIVGLKYTRYLRANEPWRLQSSFTKSSVQDDEENLYSTKN